MDIKERLCLAVFDATKLDIKEQAFVLSFVANGDATRAYIEAGYKSAKQHTRNSCAWRMLRKENVSKAIKYLLECRFEESLQKLQRMAHADMADYDLVIDGEISLKDIRDKHGVDTSMIKKLTRKRWYDKQGEEHTQTILELYPATDAIDRLMKLYGVADKLEISGPNGKDIGIEIKDQDTVIDEMLGETKGGSGSDTPNPQTGTSCE